MTSEFALDYQFAVKSTADAHRAQTLIDMIESSPNPQGFACVQGGVPYTGRISARSSGAFVLTEFQFDSPDGSNALFSCERTRSHIARNQSYEVQVFIWLGKEASLNESGRKHTLHTGDFSVTNTDTPYSFHALKGGHCCALTLPASWDRIGDTRMEKVYQDVYSGGDRRRNGLVDYARHLLARPNALALPDAAEKLYDVIALTLNPQAHSEHQTGLLALICNHIDSNSASHDLDPSQVAAAFDISVRHLHRLFAASDTSFTEYLIVQRLEHVRRMLTDPRYRHKKILNIALDCGFRNINHFGKRFRARYGLAPLEFRRAPF